MSVLRALVLLAAIPLLVAADEPGVEKRATPSAAARKAPAPASKAAPTKAPTSAEVSVVAPKAVRVFRFDALRVEGLAGPNALVLHTLQLGKRRSLVKRRRSFLYRMLEAVEVGAGGRP